MRIDEELAKYKKYKHGVFVYGAGYFGRIVARFLLENKCFVKGFIVSRKNQEVDNKSVLGRPVYGVDIINDVRKDDCKIIVAVDEKYHEDIRRTLFSYGVRNTLFISNECLSQITSRIMLNDNVCMNNSINVLIYHRVGNYGPNLRGVVIDEGLFENQLVYLKENYRIIRTDDDWTSIDDKTIVLTFDDGYCDFYYKVVPLLEKYRVPATVFITTGNIDTDHEFWGDELERIVFYNQERGKDILVNGKSFGFKTPYELKASYFALRQMLKDMKCDDRMALIHDLIQRCGVDGLQSRDDYRSMTSKEIRECSKSPFVTIGAHSVTHCCLSRESIQVQKKEMKNSKEQLEDIIGKPVEFFAYPYGEEKDFTNETIRIAKEIGFKKVFAAYRGLVNSKDEYGRIPRNDISKVKDMKASIKELKILELCYSDPYV